jgi:hypothetical protein
MQGMDSAGGIGHPDKDAKSIRAERAAAGTDVLLHAVLEVAGVVG